MINEFFDDLKVGDKKISRGRTITEADLVNFCMFSGDWHPLHSNKEFAKKTFFGERIAHGFLVLSVASALMPMDYDLVLAFYGLDKVRFTAPTKIGDTIHVEAEITELREKNKNSGVVSIKNEVKNQRGETVAVSIAKALVKRK